MNSWDDRPKRYSVLPYGRYDPALAMATISCHFALVGITDAGSGRRTTGARTGGRSERVVSAVLQAAVAELASVGYAALRLDDVATRAGVAKTTIYRRWATKAELIQAAILQTAIAEDEMLPDTGSLRGDLLALLDHSMEMIDRPEGLAIANMLTSERADPEVDQLCRSLRDSVRRHRAKVVLRAQERGDIPKDLDPLLVVDSIFSLVMSRRVRFGEAVDRSVREQAVDLIVTGAENGGGTPSRRKPR